MPWPYRSLLRPILFAQDSESIHERTLRLLARLSRYPLLLRLTAAWFRPPDLPVRLFGLRFPNPVGLAAGMDKEAAAVPAWRALGFGFSELGAVTHHAQPGNPSPRLFRAIPDRALVNRMGFNNPGAEVIGRRLADWHSEGLWPSHPVGINLGKSKVTALEAAAEDYAFSFQTLRSQADFFVVNVSSPNTPNLRRLQERNALREILLALQEVNPPIRGSLSSGVAASVPRPILVKVAPDLTFDALDDILELVGACRIDGFIATNTTLARPASPIPRQQRIYAETGGLSGAPLRDRSTEVVRHLWRQTRGTPPVIGVGGIFSAADAWEKVLAGASLVQIYTGLIYEGPGLIRRIVNGLQQRLAQNGWTELSQAVGRGTGSFGEPGS